MRNKIYSRRLSKNVLEIKIIFFKNVNVSVECLVQTSLSKLYKIGLTIRSILID